MPGGKKKTPRRFIFELLVKRPQISIHKSINYINLEALIMTIKKQEKSHFFGKGSRGELVKLSTRFLRVSGFDRSA